MKFSAFSNIGKVRKENEDSFYVPNNNDEIKLFLVADGIGGQGHGKLASMMTIDEIIKSFMKSREKYDNYSSLLADAIRVANSSVLDFSNSKSEFNGMGTTLVAALIHDNELYLSNAGDSRCYIIRKDIISQLTVDNSYVQYLLEQGAISAKEAYNHPQRNLITKAIGLEESVEIEVECIKLYPDDILLICTDGLTTMLSDEEILHIILQKKCNIDEATEYLVQCANDKGGADNITAILVEV